MISGWAAAHAWDNDDAVVFLHGNIYTQVTRARYYWALTWIRL